MLKAITRTLLFFALAYYFSDLATWGFTIARLRTTQSLGAVSGIDPHPILNQKFYLKDQGGQSYVFISADEKYVLKFFKDMPRPWIPFKNYQQKKLGKLIRTLKGYQLAFDKLKEETGLLYLHLSPTETALPTTLVDRISIEHPIDLSSVYFVLQKRASPISTFNLDQVSTLLQKRAACHIADHDPRLYDNLGWIDGQLVFIDPGRFVEDVDASSELPQKFLDHFQ